MRRWKTLDHPDDRADLMRRLDLLRPDTPRQWGRMDAHQMICHLADAMRGIMGLMQVSTGINVFNRTVVKWAAVYSPLPWPQGYPTRPELDQHQHGTRPVDFAADVLQVGALLESFTKAVASGAVRVHPIFGPMSGKEWLRWGYLHVDHHLRQFGL